MAGFTTDFSNVKEFTEFKEQFYEFIVKDIYEEPAKSGNMGVIIDLVVRNDVKQEKQNAHVWNSQYKVLSTGKYDFDKLMGKASAFIGQTKNYSSFEEFLNDFKGKVAKGKVYLDDFNGKKNPKIAYFNKTDFPNIAHVWKEPNNPNGLSQADLKDDDLPF